MKRILLLIAMAAIVGSNPAMAQNPRKAMRAVENQAAHDAALIALQNNAFVLKADQVITPTETDMNPDPNQAFILVDNGQGHFQIHAAGYVFQGKITNSNIKVKNNGTVNYSFTMQGYAKVAKVYITMNKMNNIASATFTVENVIGSRHQTSINGKLYPISAASDLIIGNVKMQRGQFMNPFVTPY